MQRNTIELFAHFRALGGRKNRNLVSPYVLNVQHCVDDREASGCSDER